MLRKLLLVLALTGMSDPVLGAVRTWTMQGTIGAYCVGVTLALRDDRKLEGAHYFYASRLTDIALQGSFDGKRLLLREPGGAVFDLALTGQKPTPPSSINDATGLAGSWRSDDKTLPVTLRLESSYPGLQTRWYGSVTDASDTAFEAMVRRFVFGALQDKRAQVAAAVAYPLRINGKSPRTILNRQELLRSWDTVFTPAYLAKLRTAVPHEMFVHNGEAMVGDGAAWFNDKGASALNP